MERPLFLSEKMDSFETNQETPHETFSVEVLMIKLGFLLKRTDFEMEVHDKINLKAEDSNLPEWAMTDKIKNAVIDVAQENFDEDIRPLLEKALEVDAEIIMNEPDLMGKTKIKGYHINKISCKDIDDLIVKI